MIAARIGIYLLLLAIAYFSTEAASNHFEKIVIGTIIFGIAALSGIALHTFRAVLHANFMASKRNEELRRAIGSPSDGIELDAVQAEFKKGQSGWEIDTLATTVLAGFGVQVVVRALWHG